MVRIVAEIFSEGKWFFRLHCPPRLEIGAWPQTISCTIGTMEIATDAIRFKNSAQRRTENIAAETLWRLPSADMDNNDLDENYVNITSKFSVIFSPPKKNRIWTTATSFWKSEIHDGRQWTNHFTSSAIMFYIRNTGQNSTKPAFRISVSKRSRPNSIWTISTGWSNTTQYSDQTTASPLLSRRVSHATRKSRWQIFVRHYTTTIILARYAPWCPYPHWKVVQMQKTLMTSGSSKDLEMFPSDGFLEFVRPEILDPLPNTNCCNLFVFFTVDR